MIQYSYTNSLFASCIKSLRSQLDHIVLNLSFHHTHHSLKFTMSDLATSYPFYRLPGALPLLKVQQNLQIHSQLENSSILILQNVRNGWRVMLAKFGLPITMSKNVLFTPISQILPTCLHTDLPFLGQLFYTDLPFLGQLISVIIVFNKTQLF